MKCTINFNKNNLESSEYDTICSTKVITTIELIYKKLFTKIKKHLSFCVCVLAKL